MNVATSAWSPQKYVNIFFSKSQIFHPSPPIFDMAVEVRCKVHRVKINESILCLTGFYISGWNSARGQSSYNDDVRDKQWGSDEKDIIFWMSALWALDGGLKQWIIPKYDKKIKKFSGRHAFPLYSVCSCRRPSRSVLVRHRTDGDPSRFLMKNTVTCVYWNHRRTDSSVATENLIQPNLGCFCFVVVWKRQCGVMWWRHEEQATFPQHLLHFKVFRVSFNRPHFMTVTIDMQGRLTSGGFHLVTLVVADMQFRKV